MVKWTPSVSPEHPDDNHQAAAGGDPYGDA